METQETINTEFLNDYDDKVVALAQHLNINLEPELPENENFYKLDRELYDTEEEYQEEQAELDKEKEQDMADAIQEIIDELESIVNDYDNVFSYYNEEYIVVTDSEADDLWEQELDNYIEECILPEMPEHLQNYFDEDAWKSDAKIDGRGHAISRYDGCEYEEEVNGTTYYIYRIN